MRGRDNRGQPAQVRDNGEVIGSGSGAGGGGTPEDIDSNSAAGGGADQMPKAPRPTDSKDPPAAPA